MVMSLLVMPGCLMFKVSVSDQECTVIQFVSELIQLLGYIALSNALAV